jgi:hypothetical protein
MSKPPPGTRPLPATTDRVRALAEHKAGKAAANIHAFDKAAEIAGRIKDAHAFREALIGKLASQREFAAQCRALFSHGGDRRSSEFQDDLSVVLKGLDAFCESFGFKIRTVQRWYGLLDSAAYGEHESAILKRCWNLAQLERPANYSSESSDWHTPPPYLEAAREVLGIIDLDPASSAEANETVRAAKFFSKEDDGLKEYWFGRVFMNPPYGTTAHGGSLAAEFCNKAIDEFRAGRVEACIILVNSVHSQSWQAPLFEYPFCLVDHRIQFVSADGEENKNPTFQNMFVYLGRDVGKFAEVFSRFGYVARKIEQATEGQS